MCRLMFSLLALSYEATCICSRSTRHNVVAANLAHPLAPSPSGTTLAAFINVSGLPFPNEGHLEGALQAPVLLAKKDWWEPRQSDLQRRPSPAPRSTDTCLAGSRWVSGSMRPGTFATLSVKILVIPTL